MKSDEEDQTSPPPHSSRTATRSQNELRVPRRNQEKLDILVHRGVGEWEEEEPLLSKGAGEWEELLLSKGAGKWCGGGAGDQEEEKTSNMRL
ncbi:hypothetical protein E3N88_09501 [Mikania micrantha]|uniref:Uncharacterized protein n=1 Tax=Mikania micrantha TaxID=192012 RepID=A0A5N6PMB4_9ASTR|nr:hypothetical protein E3N88_09501 [Mikania micrantha]